MKLHSGCIVRDVKTGMMGRLMDYKKGFYIIKSFGATTNYTYSKKAALMFLRGHESLIEAVSAYIKGES